MIRTSLLLVMLSVFIPVMAKANQREPYIYRIKPIARMETQGNKHTFTEKPVYTKTTIEPVYIKPVTDPKSEKSFTIPAYILKSLELNENKVNENTLKFKDIFSNIRPNQIEKIELPIEAENLVNPQLKLDFSNDSPEKSNQNLLQMLIENDRINGPNLLPNYRVTQFSTPLKMTGEESEKLINELTALTDNTDNNPQLPVLTEKPVYDQNFLLNEEARISNLPVITQPLSKNANKEKLMKEKLVYLFLASRKDVEKQMKNTKSIHDTFKSGTMYKIGYLTSLINKMNNRIKKLYNNVQHNQNNWDSLKILEAYEQLKKDNEMIQKLLNLMESYLRIKGKSTGSGSEALKGGDSGLPTIIPTINAISWSYYDDNLV